MVGRRRDAWARRRQLEQVQSMTRSAVRREAQDAVQMAVQQALVDAQQQQQQEIQQRYLPLGSETASATSGFDSSSAMESPSLDGSPTEAGSRIPDLPALGSKKIQKGGYDRSRKYRSKWKRLKRPFQGSQSKLLQSLTSEISKEAWMCGVCSKSFSSLLAAQRHEEQHIEEVVDDLGWLCKPTKTSPLDTDAEAGTNASKTTSVDDRKGVSPLHSMLDDTNLSHGSKEHRISNLDTPRPDRLSRSPQRPSLSSGRATNQPKTIESREQIQAWLSRSDSHGDSQRSERSPIHRRPPGSPHLSASSRVLHVELSDEYDLLVPHGMKEYVVLADEALEDVCNKAVPLLLTTREIEAERSLHYLSRDKAYYNTLEQRALDRKRGGAYNQFRTEGKSILNKVQNKIVDVYQLMKEGKRKGSTSQMDHYTRKLKGDDTTLHALENNHNTLYMNVVVKNSLKAVNYELQRLAKERWEATRGKNNEKNPKTQQFQQFRALAQDNFIKLAGMALASDFTPRRIAVQLSNDFYRLLTPKLRRRGVTIETEIEYRVGPYFVLAINVTDVDWKKLVKVAHRDVAAAKQRWKKEQEEKVEDGEETKKGIRVPFLASYYTLTKLTKYEVIAQLLAWCYYLPWFVYTPVCLALYHTILGTVFRRFFLATVSDEIFYYVEKKGMEMDIEIRRASTQAAFMLSALREIRAGGRELKKKQKEGEEESNILGPLLGPMIATDQQPAPSKPPEFVMPDNLEFVGLELDIPVGFRRLRWALLSSASTFVTEAVFRTESKHDNIETGPWSKHDDIIGNSTLPDGVAEEDIVGVEKEAQYLMPKSVFVKANMCYETSYIDAYNDYCFVLRKKALNPEVPYGSTFVAWTKYVVINTGSGTCKLICSVEAEFPNGPPMISRQIKGGMRAGVGELFVKTGETINKYANSFP